MFRVRRILGWLLVAIALVFAILLLAANLYVQSHSTRSRIQQELSQRLGTPLHIQRTSVTPWGGLKLSGIALSQPNEGKTPPFIKAKELRVRVQFRSLFSPALLIKEIALIHPTVVWPQNSAGEWRLPAGSTEVVEVPAPPKENPPAARPPPELDARSVHAKFTPPQVKRVKLIDGSFHFLDRGNRNVALFDGVEFSSTIREGTSLHGEARIARVALRDRVFLAAVRVRVRYDPGELELSDISAHIAKGQLRGEVSMQPGAEDSPFTVHATFSDVDAEQLLVDAGGARETMHGILEGSLDASGKTGNADALIGTGTLSLRGGHVQQFPLLAAIGQLLQLPELEQLDLDQAETKYHLAGQNVLIDDLTLRSPNLRLSAAGSISWTGKIALESTLAINDKIRAQLFRPIRDNFVPAGAPGEYALQFHVGGTVQKPRTDLMERAVGANLKDINGVINALLGRKKSQKKTEAAPIPSPAPTSP